MLKFNNKRDVDRHVAQLTKNLSENEVKSEIKFWFYFLRGLLGKSSESASIRYNSV